MERNELRQQIAQGVLHACAKVGDGLYVQAFAKPATVHLSEQHRQALFRGKTLTNLEVTGPKGTLNDVCVVPEDSGRTLVELSLTSAFQIGLREAKLSAHDWENSPGCTLRTVEGEVLLPCGVVIARRHVHLSPEQARLYGLAQGQTVYAVVPGGGRAMIFGDVVVQIKGENELVLHLAADEANAANLTDGQCVRILSKLTTLLPW